MTQTTSLAGPLSGAQKIMVGALLCAIVVMFVGSFVYRMQGPGLVVEVRPEGGAEGMGKGGPMAMMGVDVEQLRELMRKVEKNPDDPQVLVELANTFMMMQAWDKALDYLQKAAKVAPEDPQVNRVMGMLRFERKEYPEAKKAFELVLKKDPDDALTHYNMGVLLKHYMKKPAEGEQHFRRVVQLNPKDPEVLKGAQQELAAPAGAQGVQPQ